MQKRQKSPNPSHRQALGKAGEDLATAYLTKHGYSIISRNFKARYGEIDIIALYGQILVFIEVKARMGTSYGMPEEAVTRYKLSEVVKTSQYFVSLHPKLPKMQRIDVIAILLDGTGKPTYFKHYQSVT